MWTVSALSGDGRAGVTAGSGPLYGRADTAAVEVGAEVESDHVPDWFWEVLEATRPRLSALESWLRSQPREVLEDFALAYLDAAEALVDFSEGVSVDGDIWSEDSTEDLCMWVVGQGRGLWRLVTAGELGLEEVAQAYLGRTSLLPDEVASWDGAVTDPEHRGCQSPETIVYSVYRTRFAEELSERLLDA
ncbi:hypothetical protein R6L23_13410 [Streptomyces sp. SR27]|uniref:hypothetical protein n=1 Tax=Streptomyces sp. SR27 TaxID=3076630 RepID=UPI00295A684C|nr:hypothetical protein [Streptomyces sp. SR27]MDV9189195.1 hypothetical protein [Streptomyces sp. SR27]